MTKKERATFVINTLNELGKSVFVTSPQSIEDIIQDTESLARQLGTAELARDTIESLRKQVRQLDLAGIALHADKALQSPAKKPIHVLVMAGANDEFVIGRDRLVNKAIERCGGTNPFANSLLLAPQVSLESIISSKPDLIVTGYPPSRQIASMAEVIVTDPDLLYRPGPRFIQAASQICDALVRMRSKQFSNGKQEQGQNQ